MKIFLSCLFASVLVFGCRVQENRVEERVNDTISPSEEVFQKPYYSYTEFTAFKDYDQVSDTLIHAGNFHPQFSLLEIRKGDDHIVLLNRFSIDDKEDRVQDLQARERIILDSIHLKNIQPKELVVTGCCTENGMYGEEIIAVIERTGELYAENISEAWRANLETGKIEKIYDLKTLECINKEHKVEITEQGF